MSNSKIAIILIRGLVNVPHTLKKTLEFLRIKQKHICVVVDDNEITRGMINKVKDYITYGEIDEKMFKELVLKRGKLLGGNKIDSKFDIDKLTKEFFSGKIKNKEFISNYNLKAFFRLHPPIKGYERKGIKMPFAKGGALGNRKEKISILISKML